MAPFPPLLANRVATRGATSAAAAQPSVVEMGVGVDPGGRRPVAGGNYPRATVDRQLATAQADVPNYLLQNLGVANAHADVRVVPEGGGEGRKET